MDPWATTPWLRGQGCHDSCSAAVHHDSCRATCMCQGPPYAASSGTLADWFGLAHPHGLRVAAACRASRTGLAAPASPSPTPTNLYSLQGPGLGPKKQRTARKGNWFGASLALCVFKCDCPSIERLGGACIGNCSFIAWVQPPAGLAARFLQAASAWPFLCHCT
ncbi:hypothetical protein P7K49_016681 [Saguinus oedipus]|uniref:Uncharacterized protein n=1 Tax=Saguinus oedipus TaxID=9490 RepID=A0ABQ9VFN9_SAGOE|nr:hypothetical protein P7K49_016681 [Saguinus oedipus]